MKHTAPHTASTRTHPDPACAGCFQPRCSCGWIGEIVADEGAANAEAFAHMRSTEERMVETARERALEIIRRYAPTPTAETPLERAQRDA